MPGRRGSLNVDDEGSATQETVLIENGILKTYLSDKLSSRLMDMPNTGNGRRESYQQIPDAAHDQYVYAGREGRTRRYYPQREARALCCELRRWLGRYHQRQIRLLGVGSLSDRRRQDHRSGSGATLIGNGPEALKYVSMVGNDLELDEGVGTCGKEGQSVPVGVGMPTVKLDRMTVGGTAR